jgi:small subunit ribosomal protein S3
MGQKTNPNGFRLGIVKDWDSNWFSTSNYPELLLEDFYIKRYMKDELSRAGVASVRIKRKAGLVEIIVRVARPGIIYGRSTIDMAVLKKHLQDRSGKNINILVVEEKNADLSSRLLALWVTGQLERRIPFRRAMKMAIQRSLKAGAKGIKIKCAGRLGGVEIARSESYHEGKVPLHTLRANIDYSFTEALTTYGKIGIKVWIYKGEIYNFVPENSLQKEKVNQGKR